VVVPQVRGQEVKAAYARLHRAGLRVTLRRGNEMSMIGQHTLVPKKVISMKPAAGRRVRPGSVVTLVLHRSGPLQDLRTRSRPYYRVPNFVGRMVSAAHIWIRSKVLFFVGHLAPLRGGDARTLLANYRVDRQSPSPGTMLRFSNRDGRTTPLTVWAQPTR
jgi:beta-lactam-binding protein with PASTA domain